MRVSIRRPKPAKLIAAASLLSLTATLAACAEEGGAASGGGESVAYGATKEEFQAALEDMSPVTLVMQSTAPKGAPTGRRFEEYAAAVEDWSGGKITMDIAFSNSIAPQDQVDDAIADSRIDVGSVMASLEPDKFAAMNDLMNLTFLGRQGPVDGVLQFHGAMEEAALNSEEITKEYADNGIKLLLPIFSSGPAIVACTEPITGKDSLKGRIAATSSRLQVEQAEALGMSTATANYTELFEALERGVVDCVFSTLATSHLSGFIPAAPYFAIDMETGFGNAGGAISISKARWDELPLAAQQLLFDRVDVLLEANIRGIWDNMTAALGEIEKAKGSIVGLDEASVAAIKKINDEELSDVASSKSLEDGEAFVKGLQEDVEAWGPYVDGLEQTTDITYDNFLTDFNPADFDLKPYMELLWEKVFLSHRPA
ncbi:TRAP-type C4-dicarboxylate transport system substrate-binding protein [Nocardioides sp. J9]|uniref:TRAP transporter substrate-binding protein DctP n=1 Tax=unclassified Nocardioides TaxID=2615069 RepID=UPI0004B4B05B|nr:MULTISPECIES: TRAP transporter substrate-binding protein DctP [unclassified Nocardioides]TWG93625.1 TRAP-type C4-dicarboxylate transport system substrate-binding protein [Nocardioides sp. J9]TWG94799.1 TRAP-type C4-dicarboxylate transport system substrate-binding protein [Nocardioides sp. J9]